MSGATVPPLLAALLERLEGREALDLEFKAARGGLPNSLWSTVSAFANTRGGWIVLGVNEEAGPLSIEGVTNTAALLTTFCNLLRNPTKISYPVCGADDTSIETLNDKQVIVLRVPAAPRKIRPVHINGNPYGGTYVRRHAGDYHCTKPEVDRMMREASDIAADSAILPHFGWEDLDPETLTRYRRRYQTQNPASPWNGHDDARFLRSVGGFRRDRETGAEGITAAGLLLAGKPEALREWRTRHLIDYRLLPRDADSETRWDDWIVWEGNLFSAFETIYPRLIADQPVPFRLEGGTRIDESPVHVALREALVNLLVHADYAETQVSLIQRSPAGYLFRNPGSSRVPEGDLLTGDRSDPRNPELVRMFRYIGLADEAGTGFPKILQAWRQLGFHLPAFDAGTERYEFALDLRYAHLLSEEDRHWLRSLGESWTEAEQLALVLARHEGEVDNLTLRRLTGQHPADVTKVLGSLRSRELLQMIGGGRGARYQLGPAAASTVGQHVPAHVDREPALSRTAASSEGSKTSSDSFEQSSDSSKHSSDSFEQSSDTLSPDLWEISRMARERRHLDAAILAEIVVELCGRTPLSIRDLAELLGRSEVRVRQALRALIASGRIAFLYPEQPSHPQQRYMVGRASEGGEAR
jgi:ATP-dependent DNA helicase RecG